MADEMDGIDITVFDVIKEKEALIKDLVDLNSQLLVATLNYKMQQSELWLETDFETILNKSRPTVDEKKAYITKHSIVLREQKDTLANAKEVLLKKIELCDDKLGVL